MTRPPANAGDGSYGGAFKREKTKNLKVCRQRRKSVTCPRMPETVRMAAPSNLATSREELNMPLTKAVCLKTLKGVPTSLSFLTILMWASSSKTTPVAPSLKKINRWLIGG